MGSTYPRSLSLKRTFSIKHARRANWVRQHAPKGCFLLFEGMGDWIPIKFSHSSHQILLVPISNPSKSFCYHQLPIVPIYFLLFSSSSQKIPLFPLSSHQNPFVPMALKDRQMSTKVNGETRERLRQSAKRSAAVRGQAQWQADVSRVRQSRKSGFSGCQVLWKIAGRSALFPSWARPERERERERERENCGAR